MPVHHDINLLLQNIQKLYHKVGLYLFEIREHLHHKPTYKKSHDIRRSVSTHINELVKNAKTKSSFIQSRPNDESAPAKDYVEFDTNTKNKKHFVSTGIDTGISHKKFKKSLAKCTPTVREQLAKNTWGHIHSAIRFARQGKKTEAKLYGELANNALKEAAHYMSEQEYLNFTADIDKELSKIKN